MPGFGYDLPQTEVWDDMLALQAEGDVMAIEPGDVLEVPDPRGAGPLLVDVSDVRPALTERPASAWVHGHDQAGRPVRVYVTEPDRA